MARGLSLGLAATGRLVRRPGPGFQDQPTAGQGPVERAAPRQGPALPLISTSTNQSHHWSWVSPALLRGPCTLASRGGHITLAQLYFYRLWCSGGLGLKTVLKTIAFG